MRRIKNKSRYALQSIALMLIIYVASKPIYNKSYLADFEQYCPFGGISSFFSKLNSDTMACNMSATQVFLGLALLLGVGLVGKLFCGFICPIGTLSEWIGKIGDKFKLRREISESVGRYLRGLKYILLFVTVYFTMTTSELFCKKYDPYFAVVNMFGNPDIILFYAIPSVLITILGALFYRLFWCKYLCPLGAVSNIFLNTVFAGSVILIYFTANYFGAQLSYVWLLGGLVLSGWVNEFFFGKSFFLPVPKIIRNTEVCTNCSNCDSACPQGISISKVITVNAVDCNLCSDCVHACPVKNVITINKSNRLKYIAPITTVILVSLSLFISSYFEFSTVSLRWGKTSGQETIYNIELKNIKCYGSSMSLVSTLEDVEGILGVDTYAKSHRVKIYYDPSIISEKQIRRELFAPTKVEVVDKEKIKVDKIGILEVGVYGVFDEIDYANLTLLLKESNKVFGFETRYGEPVKTKIYYDYAAISVQEILNIIQQRKITTSISKDGIDVDFNVENNGIESNPVSLNEYKQRIFDTYDDKFNSYENYEIEKLSVYRFKFKEASESGAKKNIELLSSYLSSELGVVRFAVAYDNEVYSFVFYDSKKTSQEKIYNLLNSEHIKYFISDTETEEVKNPFAGKLKGETIKAGNVTIYSNGE